MPQRVIHVWHFKEQCSSQRILKSDVSAMKLTWGNNVAHRGFKNVIVDGGEYGHSEWFQCGSC